MNLFKIVTLSLINVFLVFNAPNPHTFIHNLGSKENMVLAFLSMSYSMILLTTALAIKYYKFEFHEAIKSYFLFCMIAGFIYIYC
jgi:DNA phosphorothioation-dependent restriction protein DptG